MSSFGAGAYVASDKCSAPEKHFSHVRLRMYAQSPAFSPYQPVQPSGFSVHSQVGPWKADMTSTVYCNEDQSFVQQFERNVLAAKLPPTIHVNTLKVFLYWCIIFAFFSESMLNVALYDLLVKATELSLCEVSLNIQVCLCMLHVTKSS